MSTTLSEIMLRANTALFAQKVVQTILDMTGCGFEIVAKSLQKGYYASGGSFAVFMHFAGRVQGDFIVTTEYGIAQKLTEQGGLVIETPEKAKELVSAFFEEILNIASGHTLTELEKKYGGLTLVPPYVVFGELVTPEVLSGNVDISGSAGALRCTLSLNLASLRTFES